MDLKAFIAATLVQIAEGIADANATLAGGETGAVINPGTAYEGSTPANVVRPVEFDIALTVTEESVASEKAGVGGKLGFLQVASVRSSLDTEERGSNRSEAVSRVRFSVQMKQPNNVKYNPVPTIPKSRSGIV